MPAFVALIGSGWRDEPEKFAFAVELSRITFPYMLLICMVSLLSGVLNSLTRFTAAAFAPALLNAALIGSLLLVPTGGQATARAMAWGVVAGGVLQFALCWIAVRRAGREAAPQAAEDDPAGQGAADPDPAGDARRRNLLHQPALLRLFRDPAARGLARLSRLCRPAEPASARDHRLGARNRDPADDQPPCRRRRRRRAPPRCRARRPSSPCSSPCPPRSRWR